MKAFALLTLALVACSNGTTQTASTAKDFVSVSQADCEEGQNLMQQAYGTLLNGSAVGANPDGSCNVELFFPSSQAMAAYEQSRTLKGQPINQMNFVSSDSGALVFIVVHGSVIGPIVAE